MSSSLNGRDRLAKIDSLGRELEAMTSQANSVQRLVVQERNSALRESNADLSVREEAQWMLGRVVTNMLSSAVLPFLVLESIELGVGAFAVTVGVVATLGTVLAVGFGLAAAIGLTTTLVSSRPMTRDELSRYESFISMGGVFALLGAANGAMIGGKKGLTSGASVGANVDLLFQSASWFRVVVLPSRLSQKAVESQALAWQGYSYSNSLISHLRSTERAPHMAKPQPAPTMHMEAYDPDDDLRKRIESEFRQLNDFNRANQMRLMEQEREENDRRIQKEILKEKEREEARQKFNKEFEERLKLEDRKRAALEMAFYHAREERRKQEEALAEERKKYQYQSTSGNWGGGGNDGGADESNETDQSTDWIQRIPHDP